MQGLRLRGFGFWVLSMFKSRNRSPGPGQSNMEFPKTRVSHFGVLVIRILLFRVLH